MRNRSTPRTRRAAGAAALVATALVASGCAATGAGQDTAGDAITVAIAAEPTSYDLEGTWAASNENYTLWSQTMVGLLRYQMVEEDGVIVQDFTRFEGVLADEDEPFTVSEDGQDYTFHLREGVVSPAGNPFTAEDVRWSVERKLSVAGGRLPQMKDYFTSIDQVEVVDDHTVTFHLDGAGNDNVFLPMFTGQMGRIWDSEEMLAHATDDDPWAVEWAAQNPGAGFGPYTVESVTSGQQIVLAANPDYVLGEPDITSITMQIVPDSGTRAQMLSAGDVDVAEALSPSDLSAVADSPNVQIPSVQDTIEFVELATVVNKEPFDDQLVRQAFRHAVPYDEIIAQVYEGYAAPSAGWMTASMGVPGVSTDPAYTFDVDRARELLAEAGQESVEVTLSVSNAIPDIVDTALLIASYAEEAGFQVTVEQLAPADFATGRAEAAFQAMLAANRSQVQVPAFVDNFFQPGDPANSSDFVATEEYTALRQAAIDAGPGTSEEAAPHWQAYSDYVVDYGASLPMLYKQPNQAYGAGLTGMSYRYDNTVDYSILSPTGG